MYSSPVMQYLLGQIVVDDQRVLSVVTEVLAHGGSGVRSEVLQRSGIRGGGAHNDGVLQSIFGGESDNMLKHCIPASSNRFTS